MADTVPVVGLALSMISVFFAVWSFIKARRAEKSIERIRTRSLFAVRGPEIVEQLRVLAGEINKHIEVTPGTPSGPQTQNIEIHLERCDAVVRNLAGKLEGGDTHRRSERLRSRIQNALKGQPVDKESLRDIHAELHGLIEAIGERLRDIQREVTLS